MDRKYSDPNIWDNCIDWDDESDGSEGGYTKHCNYIVPPAMRELVRLRAELDVARADLAVSVGHLSRLAEAYGCDDFTSAIDAALAAKGGE